MKNDSNNEVELKKVLKAYKTPVDSAIMKILFSSVIKGHQDLIKYQIEMGGKRLRPILAIISCKMMGGEMKNVLYPSAALEILHNYTLIVDDLIDRSELRRGKPTLWKKYGKSVADCVSMSYAASIFDLPANTSSKEKIYYILAKTLKVITDGQILDILFEQGGRQDENYVLKNRYSMVSTKDYYKMAGGKTASLFMSCMEVGGVCANAKEEELKCLKGFGYNLGMAFQIQDDILDIFGEEKKFGKKIGKDVEERKLGNVVMLLAMKDFSAKNKKIFLNILRKDKITNKDIKEGIALIKNTKAFERAVKLEMSYVRKAKNSLAKLPKNKWNKALEDLTDYLVKRKV